jgi:hypothetical protein
MDPRRIKSGRQKHVILGASDCAQYPRARRGLRRTYRGFGRSSRPRGRPRTTSISSPRG